MTKSKQSQHGLLTYAIVCAKWDGDLKSQTYQMTEISPSGVNNATKKEGSRE